MENKNETYMLTSRSDNQGSTSDMDTTIAREELFCCQDCGEAFKDEAAYLEHHGQHRQDTSRGSESPCDSKDRNERPLFCGLCSLSFIESGELHAHMLKHRGEAPQMDPVAQVTSGTIKQHIYECPDCGKCYGVFGHFLNHQRSHTTPSKSVFHELEQLKKKSFKCESCGRCYSRVSALDAHRRCHEGKLIKSQCKGAGGAVVTEKLPVENEYIEKQPNDACEKHFTCSCGKSFLALSRLKTHQRFSRNSQCSPETLKERPKKAHFYCNECGKSFSGRIALVQHQRWHVNHSDDGAKKFPCAECGKIFMTLTFYYKHQRMVHSEETPAKSFLHQVHQLQKKAFECKDCGLKFSRASALQAHQLHHTDVFRETQEVTQRSNLPLRIVESKKIDTQTLMEEVVLQAIPPATMIVGQSPLNNIDEDVEGYETGDFNVEIISASESEDEPQDLNPDLELVCESDQDVKDDLEVSHNSLSKPDIDLKIVQIDFEHGTQESMEIEGIDKEIRKNKKNPKNQIMVYTCDICGHETNSPTTHYSHIEKHNDDKLNKDVLYQPAGLEKRSLKCDECGKCFSRMSAMISHQLHHPKRKPYPCPDCMMSYSHASGLYNHRKVCSSQKKKGSDSIPTKKVFNPKKTLLGPKIYHCDHCGKGFWSLGAYSHHKQSQTQCLDSRQRKGTTGSLRSVNGHSRSAVKVACPVCGQKFRHKGIMKSHMRKHENGNHTCELCGRSFRVFSSLLRHQVVHSVQVLPPPIKSFQHQVEQVKKNTYSCPDCGKLFSRAKALQFHMKSHGYDTQHSPSSPRSTLIEDLQCSTCLAHFNNKSSLRAHQKLCIKKGRKEIDGTTQSSENNTHVKHCRDLSAKANKDVKGNLASETVKLKVEMKDEMNTDKLKIKSSTVDLKYKCKECDRSFSVIGALNFHKRIHLKGHKSSTRTTFSVSIKKTKHEEQSKAPFYCLECGRRFTSNSALGTHKRWHTDKKFVGSLVKGESNSLINKTIDGGPFQCKTCGKRFFYLCVFRRHQLYYPPCQVKTEPQSRTNKNTERKGKLPRVQFKCSECNKSFVRGSLLADHFKRLHKQNSESANDKEHQSQKTREQIVNSSESEVTSSKNLLSPHQCPHCSMSFAKIRGLRAHKWQAHSKGKNAKISDKIPHLVSLNIDDKKNEITPVKNTPTLISKYVVAKKKRTVGRRRKKSRLNLPPLKSIPCIDCGKGYSSAGALYNHRKVCVVVKKERREARQEKMEAKREKMEVMREKMEVKREKMEVKLEVNEAKKERKVPKLHDAPQHNGSAPKQDVAEPKQERQLSERECQISKQEIEQPTAVAVAPPLLNRQSSYTAKFLFKCNKCGKAFQTEEHLETHRIQAKSRPYCCALCCHAFWTETQLQQHLAWHDEVRQRLPIELRYRLSAAVTSRPPKHPLPTTEGKGISTSSLVFKSATQAQTGHKCQHCGKAFLSPTALQKHEAQHSGNDSYHCSLCPSTFSEIQDLIDHHQECMGDDIGQNDAPAAVILQDINDLTCLECGISFSHETELHQHYIEHAQGAGILD